MTLLYNDVPSECSLRVMTLLALQDACVIVLQYYAVTYVHYEIMYAIIGRIVYKDLQN